MTQECIMCGEPLPAENRPWWRRLVEGRRPPFHNVYTKDPATLDACWIGLNRRLGVMYPGPRPS